ncbi:hypothetical protein D3C71_1150860 [compost metagenome]
MRVGGLAILADHLLHQLHGADGLVGSRVDHGHRGIDGVADVQAIARVIEHYAEAFALQRNVGFYRQGVRVQAQHLGRAGSIAEATGGRDKHGVLLRAEGQLIQALGHRLALDGGFSGGGRGGLAEGEGRRGAEGEADGEGQRGRTEEGTWVHASVLVRGRGERSLARVAAGERPSTRRGRCGKAGWRGHGSSWAAILRRPRRRHPGS